MRWWLTTDSPRVFSVDNAAVKGMDFSALSPDVWMIQWTDGKGEIERQTPTGENLNGLREPFIDIVPYAPFFQQFLRLIKAKALLLPQAKKVQSDLIREIFESKRQAPYHYPVAAGDFWWDATDETLYSSTASGLQNAIATLNLVVDKLNAVVAHYNSNFVAVINQNAGYDNTLVAQINAAIVDAINSSLVPQINAVVTAHNNSLNHDNYLGDALITWLNDTVLSYYGGVFNSINYALHAVGDPPSPTGMNADIAHYTLGWSNPYSAAGVGGVSGVGPGTYNAASAAPWTNLAHVAVANANWIPVGATAPVNVTPAEQAAIMNGIAARTAALNVTKNTKLGQVAGLTTIDAVIDYNVTTGW